jgi:hypothetical protein
LLGPLRSQSNGSSSIPDYREVASFSRLTVPITRDAKPDSCKFELIWQGERMKDEDCLGDPGVAWLVASFSSFGMAARSLVIERHIVLGAEMPRPGEGGGEKVLSRTIAELEIGANGKAAACRVIEDNLEGALGNPCDALMGQDLGVGEPPKGQPSPRIRILSVIYTRP